MGQEFSELTYWWEVMLTHLLPSQ